jgi:AraC-like DNA-binding protein
LASPAAPLEGKRDSSAALADNLICFSRRSAAELNRPQHGRAVHHRCVLILALQTAAEVCVDERVIRLNAGQGLLVLPFQFHHYSSAESSRLLWTFITFEIPEPTPLEPLRFRPFEIDVPISRTVCELLESYLMSTGSDLAVAFLRVLLLRIQRARPVHVSKDIASAGTSNLMYRISQLTRNGAMVPTAKQIAVTVGISESHLRARFRASCGVSLGHHLRYIRMQKAAGLLHLSDRRVTEISDLCGFASVFSFSRAFRRTHGISPLAYRKRRKLATSAVSSY